MGENPELIEMARRICAKCSRIAGTIRPLAPRFLAGELDDHPAMISALAAIIETQERVAAFIEREGMTTNHAGIPVMAEVNQRIAAAIRSGQHYGKDRPHA